MKRLYWAALLACGATEAAAEGQWTLGVIAGGSDGIYTGAEDEFGIIPFASYDTERLHIGLDGLSYKIISTDQGQITAHLGYRAAPGFPDTDLFEGLEREDAVEIGIGTQWQFGNAYAGVNIMTDASDVHNGAEAITSLGYVMSIGDLQLDASVGGIYRNAELNQYLFGVGADEATATRPAFAADDTVSGFASLTAAYPITDQIVAFGQVGYQDLSVHEDSPLIDKDGVVDVGLGVMMTF
ncbi:MipA/OmpV family protein [Yoonia sp. BS5-3]|uniref:MipA/OmpV family protein n=1 Tax=Yoonia phaeophyticola TaxID=3137369 RepID=A0ABZ2V7I5_9RHOB